MQASNPQPNADKTRPQKLVAKEQWKNRWTGDSACLWHTWHQKGERDITQTTLQTVGSNNAIPNHIVNRLMLKNNFSFMKWKETNAKRYNKHNFWKVSSFFSLFESIVPFWSSFFLSTGDNGMRVMLKEMNNWNESNAQKYKLRNGVKNRT